MGNVNLSFYTMSQSGQLPYPLSNRVTSKNSLDDLDDLQLNASVDNLVQQQHIPIPSIPTTTTIGTSDTPIANSAKAASTDQPQKDESTNYFLKDSAHPISCIFHVAFKIASLLLYIIGGILANSGKSSVKGANFVVVTVFSILLLAADFWVVKNVTGRLLVGLRWWNMLEPDGSTKWIFESAENYNGNIFDRKFFWSVLYTTPLLWFVLLIVGLLKVHINWLIIVFTAIILSGSNVYGYYKCSKDQKAKVQQMMNKGAQLGALATIQKSFGGMSSFTT